MLSNHERAVSFLMKEQEVKATVTVKADGSTPAWWAWPDTSKAPEELADWLNQEVLSGNFQREFRTKGYGSIFLISSNGYRVLHIRVIGKLGDGFTFYYLD